MPIKPREGETQSDFMGRCVPTEIGTGPDKRPQDQAVAICLDIWRQSKKGNGPVAADMQTVERAWARLELKDLQTEQREITGIASTPETDRMGDVVESLGLQFKNPLPLLWQHKHDQPIGLAVMNQATADGITFKATLAKIDEPGALKERIDGAWQAIKAGLVRGISIGFRSIEHTFLKGGGIRFVKSELVELSLVTVPANAGCSIQEIRTLDAAALSGSEKSTARARPDAGAQPPPKRKGNKMPMTISEQITAFSARRDTAATRMTEIMNKAADAGATLDRAESDEYDGLQVDVENIDAHIKRLTSLEAQNRAAATPALNGEILPPVTVPVQAMQAPIGVHNAQPVEPRVISVRRNVPQGIPFIRYAIAMAAGGFNRLEALEYARRQAHWKSETPEIEMILASQESVYHMKTPVAVGTTVDSTWAGPLVVAQNLASEFAEFLRPLTIIGRIPGLRRVPFNISVPRATAGTSGNWVGEGAPKPVSSMAFDTITLRFTKAAVIVAITEELARFSNPSAEAVVRADMAAAITQFLDRQFVDPSVAAVTNVNPASITNGVTPITASGTTMAAFRADVASLMQQFLNANLPTSGGVWLMTQSQGTKLGLTLNALGQNVYPTVSGQGGTLLGYPVVTSENIPATGGSPADGFPLIFLIAPEILLADDGQVTVDASREATLQLDTVPDSPATGTTNYVSLWQTNQIGLKAERYINWVKRRSTAVQFIQNAKYAE